MEAPAPALGWLKPPFFPQAVGISVEFVSHITRSFAISTKPTRLERAKEATISMGSAVSDMLPCMVLGQPPRAQSDTCL